VAFTSGKDSMVVAWMVEQITRGVTLAWSDDELEYPETVAIMEQMAPELMFVVTSGYSWHNHWFHPWVDTPFWRAPLPQMVWITEDQDDYMARQGYDLTFTGLRAEESRKRRDWLTYSRSAFETPGLYPVRSGTGLRCAPLHDWTVDDVWAYTYAHNLPVNPVYDRLSEIGVEPRRQRVGPLPLARRADLVAGWPDMLDALESRYGKRWT
jgi:phosphoadenosine phosphosulfate reductase